MNAEESLQRLVEGNDRYLTSRNEIGDISPFARTRTAVEGQHPFAVIICCSDSREIPEAIFSSGIGDLFVIRVAGNVIDSSILGSVEYACSHLGCPLVVVLGHTRCGAVDAALSGHADGYIRCIADRISEAIGDETDPLTRENLMDRTFEVDTTNEVGVTVTETHTLDEFATVETDTSVSTISRENQQRYISVTADTLDGYNSTRLSMALSEVLEDYEMPDGYTWEMAGEYETVISMMTQMIEMLALGLLFVYLVMVAQFQSLLSPFIILFTVPLAFTGGMFGLMAFGEQLSLLSMIGFLVLMGTVVNNGIVFVDYTNQLRLGGMEKRAALIATGKTRMRPILMTALTTILAMGSMMFSTGISASLTRGMAIVVACGLAYATLMTLFVVPVMYDLLYRRQPREIDVGDDTIDDVPDDAAEFLQQARAEEAARAGK